MSILSKLFGRSKPAADTPAETEIYKGFTIQPGPQKEGSSFRIAALITKDIDGETKSHHLIRADTLGSLDAAKEASTAKAKLVIDQMGDRIFR